MKSILVAGHSHIYSWGFPGEVMTAVPTLMPLRHSSNAYQGLTGVWPRDEFYWDSLLVYGVGKIVALSWMGNNHMSLYLFASPAPFDLINADEPDLPVDPSAQLVPEAVFIAQIEQSIALPELASRVERLKKRGIQTVLCGTPPPKEDDDFIRKYMTTRIMRCFSVNKAFHGQALKNIPFSPPLMRYKLWRVMQTVLENAAKYCGIPFFPVPAETQTREGFLRRDMYLDDMTHANIKFGKVMMDKFLVFADSL